MAEAGVDAFTFHIEVTSVGEDLTPFILSVKSKGMKVGLALKPG
jgi:pentose-5-phosphate-3-epimerase